MELKLVQQQKQILTLNMQQSLSVLQMSTPELAQRIQDSIMSNPLIEATDAAPDRDSIQKRQSRLEWLDRADESNAYRFNSLSDDERIELPFYDHDQGQYLSDVLLLQLPGYKLPARIERIVRELIFSLDERGYLSEPEQLAAFANCSEADLQRGISILQSMDPPGTGARDLRECLLIQAKRGNADTLLIDLISSHLNDLARNSLTKIAAELNVTIDDVKHAKERLLQLNPKPGNGYASRNKVSYTQPDLVVVCRNNELKIFYNAYDLPQLSISSLYTEIGKNEPYIQECIKEAELLISSISRRRTTILACSKAILDRQNDFFRLGPGHMQPMTLNDVAADIGMNPSTVCRAVNNKYIQCQWGIMPLGKLFTRSLNDEADDTSRDMVISQLKLLIVNEDKRAPLSDQQLTDLLNKQGIPISRRTIAKFRGIAQIPAAKCRQQF